MKFSMKSLIAGSALALASTSALAFTDPFGPEGSSVSLLVYNGSSSYLLDLGTYDQTIASINGLAPGAVLTFALPQFSSTFGLPNSDPGGSYGAGIRFGVFGANSNIFNNLSTSPTDITIDDSLIGSQGGAIQTFYGDSNVGAGNPNATLAIANVADSYWGGEPADTLDLSYFGENQHDSVPWILTSQNLSDSIGFYSLTLDDFDTATDESTLLGNWRVVYSAALGGWAAEFTALGGGSPVPVPAAVWLLLSGLAGLGVIGRRKAAIAA